ncbi:hypothetical protein BCR41DRAFT_332843 [Lobosporangium transversale]|uniref:Uncharacterized protein n=1 Tax=Lobosporangium transversale TaxID=64571 RepID=A0A1Y2GWW3_9FUNG|nr:hypothetical protein BCR41DRAFT_332843 [Lobosporangium transversale]ORZ26790.1 hypothetical protein BCR41DRAFT_332843 [Lobosporangium transversale]|eukprot:XP_021884553.1 hypothetical protein BCR41DRAFT_332843 [Lobosporangium transversale]
MEQTQNHDYHHGSQNDNQRQYHHRHRAPPSPVTINPSRRATAPPNIKKPVPNWHLLVRPPMSDANPRKSGLERAMDEDLKELRVCMDLFLNSKMNEAEALLRGRHKPESMYYQFGKALVDALKAILTFHPDDIEKAMKSFDLTLKVTNAQRKTSSIIGVSTVKALGSWVIGTVGASSFRGMTRIEKHAELVYAEATVLRAGFSVLYHQDFWSLIEESVSLRSAFAVFNGLKSHFDNVEQELKVGGDISEYHLDEHLVTGLIFAASLFNIVISFLPDIIIKLLQFVGFPSDRDWGLALLNTAGQWDPYNVKVNESEMELQERVSSPTNDGMRRQLCDLAPIVIHLIAASFLPFRHVDYSFAEQINNYNLHKYPESMVFLFLKARHAQVNTRLSDAIKIHESAQEKVQKEWRNLTHASTFEQLMCAMMESNHDLACTTSRILLRESNWTKTIFRYLAAITTMRRGLPKEAKRVPELMKKVEPGMQKFCGIEVFPETYCARKANRYLNEGQRLLLPDYDFLVLWNGFDMMPLKSLRVALSNIMVEVQRIHSLTKADKVRDYDHYYDDYCIAHYLLGLVAKNIAFFPEEAFDQDMCSLATRSFKTVFRYAPYIKDDTYAYYFSHYNMGLIMMNQGRLDQAEEKFKYLLSTINPTLLSLPALIAGKGRNSLEALILAKAHAAMFLLNEDRANAAAAAAAAKKSQAAKNQSKTILTRREGRQGNEVRVQKSVGFSDSTFSSSSMSSSSSLSSTSSLNKPNVILNGLYAVSLSDHSADSASSERASYTSGLSDARLLHH